MQQRRLCDTTQGPRQQTRAWWFVVSLYEVWWLSGGGCIGGVRILLRSIINLEFHNSWEDVTKLPRARLQPWRGKQISVNSYCWFERNLKPKTKKIMAKTCLLRLPWKQTFLLGASQQCRSSLRRYLVHSDLAFLLPWGGQDAEEVTEAASAPGGGPWLWAGPVWGHCLADLGEIKHNGVDT